MSQNYSLARAIKSQAGWYRGDFHAHTTWSDGYFSPPELIDVARAEGLDFCAVTDHNTIEALPELDQVSDLLVIPGIEVTTQQGHFNIFGMEGWLDWMKDICIGQNCLEELDGNYRTTTQLMQQTSAQGLLNSINHPLLTPWDWLDFATDLRYVNCLEIWNDPSWPDNAWATPQAVALWTEWLNAGYRITAIGGSDYHRPTPEPGQNKPAERLGRPSTYVYATELSGAAILAGLRQRRAYVSMGPQVTFQAHANGAVYPIGAALDEPKGEIRFTATVSSCPPLARIQIVKNGNVIAEAQAEAAETTLQGSNTPAAPSWYRLDVLDRHGQILAVTNPIFVGVPPPPAIQSFGDFGIAGKQARSD